MPKVEYENHTIEAINRLWGETVKYDGKVMTKGFSVLGHTYQFVVNEEKQAITYDVQFKAGFPRVHFNIKRNGKVIYNS